MSTLFFPHPAVPPCSLPHGPLGRTGPRSRVLPVFLPYQGCPGRCLFCAQHLQTGRGPADLEHVLAGTVETLAALERSGGRAEVGFFGGTFTLLPGSWPERFLSAAAPFRERGVVTGLRCSTRPDAVDPERLAGLKGLGLTTVELGVQSFEDAALAASGRGYGRDQALAGCAAVRGAGLDLVVQLMPGLPGGDPGHLDRDAEAALGCAPGAVRLYPCLVLEGTALAGMWRAGAYRPWGLPETVERLARAVARFWSRGVAVIRTGLAPEPGLDREVLAGPGHPALGQMVRSRTLFESVRARIPAGTRVRSLAAPAAAQGEFWGHRGDLRGEWAALGLTPERVRFEDRPDFGLEI